MEDDSEKARREFLQYRLSLKNALMQMRDDMGLTNDDVPDLSQDPKISQIQETSRALGLRLYWSLMFAEEDDNQMSEALQRWTEDSEALGRIRTQILGHVSTANSTVVVSEKELALRDDDLKSVTERLVMKNAAEMVEQLVTVTVEDDHQAFGKKISTRVNVIADLQKFSEEVKAALLQAYQQGRRAENCFWPGE